ncbi:host attachment family protein [Pseudodonghicola flavimaris]|uniref:Host attachment family protein n=1 Tax=Pseudodonghicola flavimaris TaxID=3050036 RepID=A0ABT7F2H4_9RHOB|nr:host attachment family protein [Pseudodonghicola flavimaris]MDK3018695.1 host attachment family protein [Pseudodonghicola flavimaris]
MPELTNGTWVVVADGEKALLMRNLTDHADPNFEVIAREDHPEVPQDADRPGRRADGGPNQMSAMEAADWHVLVRERFAKELAALLYAHAHRGAFDRLVIAADPKLLGQLREELHSEVRRRVVAEIPKTLTNHPRPKIESELKAALDAM